MCDHMTAASLTGMRTKADSIGIELSDREG